jgi:hypothetical protein
VEDRDVNDVVYLYGFVPAAAPPPPAELAGLGNGRVRLLDVGDVRAVVSRLAAADYGDIDRRLEDLGWVGEQGLAHERVVLWYVDRAQILPARLFSLYSDEAALQAAVRPQAAAIAAQLERLGDRREWNLKVACDMTELGRHGSAVSAAVRSMDEEIAAAPPGRRYLLQRKRADLLKQELGGAARRLAGELLDALRPHAVAVRALPLSAADDAAGTVVLNAALLVSRPAEAALREEAERQVARHRELGILAQFSGPWAPYRFLEEESHG